VKPATGFYTAITASGKEYLAFNCDRCHHEYFDCPPEIPHCGTVARFEKSFWKPLPKVQIGQRPAAFVE